MTDRVLLVDGEANRRRLLRKRLERRGYEVVGARSVAEALQLPGTLPAVVVMDLTLLCGPEREQADQLMSRAQGAGVTPLPRAVREAGEAERHREAAD